MLAGLSNTKTSTTLGRVEPTIKQQVPAVLRKRRVPSRAQLIASVRVGSI
jgi:DNA-binding NarL/FixJ family response regulator